MVYTAPVGVIVAVARNTWKEAVRDRLLFGILFFGVAMLFSGLVLGEMSMYEERRVVVDVGLAGISLFSVVIATVAGVNLLYKEMERKTLFTVLSKPISRWQFVVGKFAGLAATILVVVTLMAVLLVLMLLVRGMKVPDALAGFVALIAVESVVIIGLAVFFSSFATPFMSGVFTIGLFLIGRNADVLAEMAAKRGAGAAGGLMDAIVAVTPNLYLFYPSGRMFEEGYVSIHGSAMAPGYVGYATVYGLAYAACLVLAAVAIFRRRDVV
ncbi:MAG: ABC transporter permease subunit [Myxococcota bacterium]|nr:ABC transporter permease subunit [Myxococcota bacterium]